MVSRIRLREASLCRLVKAVVPLRPIVCKRGNAVWEVSDAVTGIEVDTVDVRLAFKTSDILNVSGNGGFTGVILTFQSPVLDCLLAIICRWCHLIVVWFFGGTFEFSTNIFMNVLHTTIITFRRHLNISKPLIIQTELWPYQDNRLLQLNAII